MLRRALRLLVLTQGRSVTARAGAIDRCIERRYRLIVALTLDDVLERTRHIAASVVALRAEEIDREAIWPEQGLRALQGAGLGGLVVPKHHGGLGFGLLALTRTCEELGQACSSTAMNWGMHHVGAAVISAKATSEQRQQYLEPIVAGTHLTTLALSEPGTGSHFYIPETRLTDLGSSLLVSGTKSFVTNGGRADSYVLSTAALAADSIGQFSCIIVPKEVNGLKWGPEWAGVGMRGNSSRSVELNEVEIPRRDLLGELGDELWYVFNVVTPYFMMAMAGTYVGVATAALQSVVSHVSERRHSHTAAPIAHSTIVQHRIGELSARVERTRALLHHAATVGDEGQTDALPLLCSSKAEAADCAVNVANEAMTLMGGRGYAVESRIHRLLRDARAAHVMAPTTDQLRVWTGRALLGQPLLAE